MKKVWDFLLLVVSGLLVFVAIIAVAIGLSQDDEPPATADSRGESTEKVVAAHATAPSALATVPASPATVPETPGATPAAVQRHEPMAGAPVSTVPSTAPTSAAQPSGPLSAPEGYRPNSS